MKQSARTFPSPRSTVGSDTGGQAKPEPAVYIEDAGRFTPYSRSITSQDDVSKKRRKSNRRPGSHHTKLAKHKRKGTQLVPPLADVPIKPIDWSRDLLPEFLWIGALADEVGIDVVHTPYGLMMEAIDEVWSCDDVPIGLLSDFGRIESSGREELIERHDELITELFRKPIGRILSYYPDCPCSWLIGRDFLEDGGHLDPEEDLGRLRGLLLRLYPGRDEYCARLRTLPLGRIMKHGKLYLPQIPT